MTVTTGFFDATREYTAAEFARALQAATASGVVQGIGNTLAVSAGPGLGVTVATGYALLQGYWYYSDATQAVALLAADVTNPRIDRIILRLTVATKTVELTKLTGTPAGSPAAPALTQTTAIYELSLAQVAVAANAVAIVGGNLTDERTYAGSVLPSHVHTVAANQGGVVPHGNLSGIGTNTHAQVDTHIAASAAVHGLPASVNVLGNRNAAAEFVQRGSGTVIAVGSATTPSQFHTLAITFPVAFGSTPRVFVSDLSGGWPTGCSGVNTTGTTAVLWDTTAGVVSHAINWLAIGG